jgi:hypothetical protein
MVLLRGQIYEKGMSYVRAYVCTTRNNKNILYALPIKSKSVITR